MSNSSAQDSELRTQNSGLAYQLKITLRGIRPPVWRRVLVPPETTTADLHQILQVLFDWSGDHLHEFDFGRAFLLRGKTLAEKGVAPGMKFTYVYDLGDYWVHGINVEKLVAPPPSASLPLCTTGTRAAPPEDCGDYGYFLDAVTDPDHEAHDELLDWIGGSWDPEAFDLQDTNRRLEPLRRKLARRAAKAAKEAATAPMVAAPAPQASRGARPTRVPAAPPPPLQPSASTTGAIAHALDSARKLLENAGIVIPFIVSVDDRGEFETHLPPEPERSRRRSAAPVQTGELLRDAKAKLLAEMGPRAPAYAALVLGEMVELNMGRKIRMAITVTAQERGGGHWGLLQPYIMNLAGTHFEELEDMAPREWLYPRARGY